MQLWKLKIWVEKCVSIQVWKDKEVEFILVHVLFCHYFTPNPISFPPNVYWLLNLCPTLPLFHLLVQQHSPLMGPIKIANIHNYPGIQSNFRKSQVLFWEATFVTQSHTYTHTHGDTDNTFSGEEPFSLKFNAFPFRHGEKFVAVPLRDILYSSEWLHFLGILTLKVTWCQKSLENWYLRFTDSLLDFGSCN